MPKLPVKSDGYGHTEEIRLGNCVFCNKPEDIAMRFIISIAIVCLIVSPALANSVITDLFLSEYIEGSSNNKALEIFNGTGGAINLGTGA